VRQLEAAGFVNKGGSRHDTFTDGVHITRVPRHSEIGESLYREILKQAGLDKR